MTSNYSADEVLEQLARAGREVATADEFDAIVTMAGAALADDADPVAVVAELAAALGHAINFAAYSTAAARGADGVDLEPLRDTIQRNVLAAVAVWRDGPAGP